MTGSTTVSASEAWDPAKVAAECKATADAKVKRSHRRRKGAPPPIPETATPSPSDPPIKPADEGRDPASGRFLDGHPPIGAPSTGRPTKYDPAFCESARKLCTLGATLDEIADFLGVGARTVDQWKVVHEEFAEAIKIGWKGHMARATRSLYEKAVGYDYVEEVPIKIKVGKDLERVEIVEVRKHQPSDTQANMYIHNNRDPDNWRHVRQVQVSGTIEHVTVDQAKRELEDFYRNGGGEIIDLIPVHHLPAPDSETAAAVAATVEEEDDI